MSSTTSLQPTAAPLPGLAHEGTVAVIGEGDPALEAWFQPCGQWNLLPAGQVDADARYARIGIHGTRQTNSHHRSLAIGVKETDGLCNLHAHRARSGGLWSWTLRLRQQLPIDAEQTQLDRGSPEIHPHNTRLRHQKRMNS